MVVLASAGQVAAQFGARQDIIAIYLFNGQDEATFRRQLEARCALRVSQIGEVAQLDEATLEKLSLAIRGDLNRFYRCISIVRENTKGFDIQDQGDMQKAWQEIMPLQQRISKGLLEEDSLFNKVLDSSLSEIQSEAYQQYLSDRQDAKTQAIVKVTIAELDRTIPMLAKQRSALLESLLAKKFPSQIPQGYDAYLGYIMLTKVEKAELQKIFDKPQIAAIEKMQAQYAAYGNAVTW